MTLNIITLTYNICIYCRYPSMCRPISQDIGLSPIDIADQPTMFDNVCARSRVGCFAAIVILLYRPGSQTLQQQQTIIDELTPMSERIKFELPLSIVSYHRITIFCVISIVSYRFPLWPYRANTTNYY